MTLRDAAKRLREFASQADEWRFYSSSTLASVIWPNKQFLSAEEASEEADKVCKRLGMPYVSQMGWLIEIGAVVKRN